MKRVRKNGISWFLDEHEGLEAVVEGIVESGRDAQELHDQGLRRQEGVRQILSGAGGGGPHKKQGYAQGQEGV